MNRSNLSFLALHIGQTSGGPSRAHRYPQTLHLQTGRGSEERVLFEDTSLTFERFSGGGRRSGMLCTFWSPFTTAWET